MNRGKQLVLVAVAVALVTSGNLFAQSRPSSVDLLPQETVAYVQIPSVEQLKEDFSKTGFGQMVADERVKPLIDAVYQELDNLYATYVEEEIGVGLGEILTMPAGEVCFAVVAPKRKKPAFVLLMDLNQESDTADRLLEKGRELAENDGATLGSETEGEFEIQIVEGNDDDEYVAYVRQENTILACTNREVLGGILARWTGNADSDDKTLADNRKFITLMNRCSSVHDDHQHQLAFYIDPFELISSALRGEGERQFVMGILRTAGLDGLLAIGGTSLFNEQGYESIFHLHVSLSNPRKGVFKIIALKPGQYQPEPWVPKDVISYMTSNWDVNNVYQQIQGIYESYNPPTPWEEMIEENFENEIGLNLKEDIVDQLEGRVTYLTWNEPPARLNSQLNVLAIGLKNPEEFRDKVFGAIEDRLVEDDAMDNIVIDDYEGIEIWKSNNDEQMERRELEMEEEGITAEFRFPDPCVAIVGNSLIISESPKFMELAIDTFQGNSDSLAGDAKYTEVTDHITRLLKSDLPSMSMYSRPDEQFRNLFEVAGSDGVKDFLDQQAENFEFAGGLAQALEDNPLPSFDDLSSYLAPSGAFVTNDETGLHMLAFQLKSEKVLEETSK